MAPRTHAQRRRAERDRRREQRRPRTATIGWRDLMVALRDWGMLSRPQRTAAAAKWLTLVAGLAAAVVLGLVGNAFYSEYGALPNSPVATVGSEPITATEYRDFLSFRRYQLQQELAALDADETVEDYEARAGDLRAQLGGVVFNGVSHLAHAVLIRDAWTAEGHEVAPDDLRAHLATLAGVAPEREDAQASAVEAIREATGLDAATIERFAADSFRRQRLADELFAATDPMPAHVKAVEIVLAREEDAAEVIQRIEDGEAMEDVAREVSVDSVSRTAGGEVDWTPSGIRPEVWDAVAFTAPIGELVGPFEGNLGWYLLRVTDRVDERPLSAEHARTLRARKLDAWLAERTDEQPIEYMLTTEIIDWTDRNSLP